MASSEICEDAICVLSIDFGEEVFPTDDLSLVVHVGCIMVTPFVKSHLENREYRLGFVPTLVANSSVKHPRRATSPLIP